VTRWLYLGEGGPLLLGGVRDRPEGSPPPFFFFGFKGVHEGLGEDVVGPVSKLAPNLFCGFCFNPIIPSGTPPLFLGTRVWGGGGVGRGVGEGGGVFFVPAFFGGSNYDF